MLVVTPILTRVLGTLVTHHFPYGPVSESHGDRLAVHAPGNVAAQERDHLRDLARLQDPVLTLHRGFHR
jgi:hypothetical protein